MKKRILLLTLFGLFVAASAQGQDTLWTRYYYQADSCYDVGYCVDQTGDGGYVMVGHSKRRCLPDTADYDVFVVKTDGNGDTLWTRLYDEDGQDDEAYSVQVTNDDGIIICGRSMHQGNTDVYLLKLDSGGNYLWSNFYDLNFDDGGMEVQQTSDGGYIVTGYASTPNQADDVCLVKTDAAGNMIWQFKYGGYLDDWGFSVKQTADGGYIVAGWTASFGNGAEDVYLLRMDGSGALLWSATYGGNSYDDGFSIQITSDGGYIIAGRTQSYGAGSFDAYLLKTNASGFLLWTRTFGTNNFEDAQSIELTSDGGYVMAGSAAPGYNQVYVIKTDAQGILDWDTTYGGADNEYGYCVRETNDGCYIVSGRTYSYSTASWDVDYYLIKLQNRVALSCSVAVLTPNVPSVNGNLMFQLQVTNSGNAATNVYGELYPTVGDCITGIPQDFNLTRLLTSGLAPSATFIGRYMYNVGNVSRFNLGLCAVTIDIGPALNNWVANCCDEFNFFNPWGSYKPGAEWGTEWLDYGGEFTAIPSATQLGSNYPNPFNAQTQIPFTINSDSHVRLNIYNIAGELVETLIDGNVPAGEHTVTWDAEKHASGVYFYKLMTGDQSYTKRMTLLK